MSDAASRQLADLNPADRDRLIAAHAELRAAVQDYQSRFVNGGEEMADDDAAALDPSGLGEAQERIAAAEDRLWRLREELLGWPRPSWTPSASLTADWFSEEDAVYDDTPSMPT